MTGANKRKIAAGQALMVRERQINFHGLPWCFHCRAKRLSLCFHCLPALPQAVHPSSPQGAESLKGQVSAAAKRAGDRLCRT